MILYLERIFLDPTSVRQGKPSRERMYLGQPPRLSLLNVTCAAATAVTKGYRNIEHSVRTIETPDGSSLAFRQLIRRVEEKGIEHSLSVTLWLSGVEHY